MKHLYIIALIFLVSACNTSTKPSKETTSIASEEIATTDNKLKFKSRGIQTIYSTYENLRDALVATDFETAKKYASELKTAFEQEDKWQEASIAASIKEAAEIGLARESFFNLNEAVEPMLKENLESGEINKCYCPMARDNQGGSWFTTETEINNPYFGDQMLRCGKITETIK